MTEQIKKIEKSEKIEPDEEALEKIRKIQSSGPFGGIKRDLFHDIQKELFEPIHEKFQKKYPNTNWDILTEKEIPKDYAKALEEKSKEFTEIIKNKKETEILERAKKIYQFEMEKNKNFKYAYDIARWYLDQKSVKIAAEKTFQETLQKIEKSKEKNEKINAAAKVFSTTFVPEIERTTDIMEKALNVILQSRWFKERPYAVYFRIKTIAKFTEWQLPKNKEFLEFVNPRAREEIEKLLEKEKKQEAVDLAEFYEKKGFLDLESDNDLFEKLTK